MCTMTYRSPPFAHVYRYGNNIAAGHGRNFSFPKIVKFQSKIAITIVDAQLGQQEYPDHGTDAAESL